MSVRALAILHNAEVELQALVCRRLAMFAENLACEIAGKAPEYTAEHFDALAAEMRQSCWVDPTTLPE